jgi:hypothetical protein|tara:strand:+ start:2240 stop:2827 length:588 start_codon:yes stop_codon:yes gene_type:complete
MKYTIKLSPHEAQIFNIANSAVKRPNLNKVLIEDNNLYATDGNVLIAVPCKYKGRVEVSWRKNWKIGKSKKYSMTLVIDTTKNIVTSYSDMWGEITLESVWGDDISFPQVERIYHSINANKALGKNRSEFGLDVSLLSKITSVIGEKIAFNNFFGDSYDPIAIFQNFGSDIKKPFTEKFDKSIHRPCVIMPMRIR